MCSRQESFCTFFHIGSHFSVDHQSPELLDSGGEDFALAFVTAKTRFQRCGKVSVTDDWLAADAAFLGVGFWTDSFGECSANAENDVAVIVFLIGTFFDILADIVDDCIANERCVVFACEQTEDVVNLTSELIFVFDFHRISAFV